LGHKFVKINAMEEPKKIVDLDAIPSDKVVNIEMPTVMYLRLNRLIHGILANKSPQEVTNALKEVGEGKQETDEQFNLYTLLYIQILIEEESAKQGYNFKVKFDTEKQTWVD
jgi:hypothetical protein